MTESSQDPSLQSGSWPAILPEGTTIGRHRIDARLRDGGMSTVYIGEHVETQARVAIKVLRPEAVSDPEAFARFDREAKVMGRLSGCEQIVAVHDVGSLPDGRRYAVMSFIRGVDLDDLLAELISNDETMEIRRACIIARDVALGLAAAHAKKIVHRDVKPANIMVEQRRGGAEAAKLVDFGVSADLRPEVASQLTSAGAVLGTVEYMAPEQAAGVPAAASFDIYALGVVLLEMLILRKPPARAWEHQTPRVSELRSDVPPGLQELIEQMVDADPTRRLASVDEVWSRLDGLIATLAETPPATPTPAAPRPAAMVPRAGALGLRAGELSSTPGAAGATVPAPGRSAGPAVLVSKPVAVGGRRRPDATVVAGRHVPNPPRDASALQVSPEPVAPAATPSSGSSASHTVVAPSAGSSHETPAADASGAQAAVPSGATRAEELAFAPPSPAPGPDHSSASSGSAPIHPQPPSGPSRAEELAAAGAPSRAAELAAAAKKEAELQQPAVASSPSLEPPTPGPAPQRTTAEPRDLTWLWIVLAVLGFGGLLAVVWLLVRPAG